MPIIYFSFKTFRFSGIGDQIGAQFSHCYSLGCHCGWTYLHLAPFEFDRSTPGSNGKKCLSNVSEYLGLSVTDPWPYDILETSVSLSSLVETASSLQQVRDRMNLLVSRAIGSADCEDSISRSILVHIELDASYHSLIPRIQQLTGLNWEKTLQFSGLNYLRSKKVDHVRCFENNQIAVAHIRLGDCIRIDTDTCPVILHGHMIFTSIARYQQEIGSVDPSRVSRITFRPFDFLERVKTLLQVSCIQPERLYLVSDGFKATKRCILSHVLQRNLRPHIGFSALRKLNALERMFENASKWVPLSQRIIGEDPHHTLLSIDLFSRASLLMCNSGGFSNAIHHVYSPSSAEPDSFVWL